MVARVTSQADFLRLIYLKYEKARERLAFNELLFLQLLSVQRKMEWQKNNLTHILKVEKKEVDKES